LSNYCDIDLLEDFLSSNTLKVGAIIKILTEENIGSFESVMRLLKATRDVTEVLEPGVQITLHNMEQRAAVYQ
jgi:hypothetical protein